MQRHAIASTVYTGSIGQSTCVCYDKQLDHSGGQNSIICNEQTEKHN